MIEFNKTESNFSTHGAHSTKATSYFFLFTQFNTHTDAVTEYICDELRISTKTQRRLPKSWILHSLYVNIEQEKKAN